MTLQQCSLPSSVQFWLEEHEQQMIADICSMVRIPSVSEEQESNLHPYGKACLDSLLCALSMGKAYGFEAYNHENYCGSLYWRGENDSEIGFFGHTDVVPAGGGWSGSPFEPLVKDGLIIGRGACDNKGAVVTLLYALRYLKECGYEPIHSLRFFLGCNEEKGMSDLEYYIEHYGEPEFSIVPDVTFPVCNGEKGILEIDAEYPMESQVLRSFRAGIMSNAVPAKAEAVLRISAEAAESIRREGAKISEGDCGEYLVRVEGIATHAAFPEGSESAEVKLADLLLKTEVLDEKASELMKKLLSVFGDYYGSGLNVPYEDEVSGKLTHVGGISAYESGVFRQNINIRYNIMADHQVMRETIEETLTKQGFKITSIHDSRPCYTKADHPVVQELNAICSRHLGMETKPYVMGGGTYARKLQNAVGFGPSIPNAQKRFGTERGGAHQPDEYVEISHLKRAFAIYVEAIIAMDRML